MVSTSSQSKTRYGSAIRYSRHGNFNGKKLENPAGYCVGVMVEPHSTVTPLFTAVYAVLHTQGP